MPQTDRKRTISPNHDVKTESAIAKAAGPEAAAMNHHTAKTVEISSALPVIRVKIDVIDVICGL
jgi:hypothetical protein